MNETNSLFLRKFNQQKNKVMGDNFISGGAQFIDDDELFIETPATQENQEQEPEGAQPDNKQDVKPTEVVVGEGDDLFGDSQEQPESVGEEDKDKDTGKKAATEGDGDSPKDNVFSSFAKAMKGDGLFQFLDDKVIDSVTDETSFADAFEQEINARLDAETRRVKEALDAGVPVNTIQYLTGMIKRYDSITEDTLSAEGDEAAKLRKNIIYQDYINRGFTKERALREVTRSVEGGHDKEDAKEALESSKQFYQDKYDDLIAEGQAKVEEDRKRARQENEDFKKEVLSGNKLFGSIEIDKASRQKAYEAMTKIVDNDEDGSPRTAVQKFADEHPAQFRAILGLTWVLTDKFQKLGDLVQGNIKKEVRSNLKAIGDRISSSTPRGGSPRFIGGEEEQERPKPGSWRFDV